MMYRDKPHFIIKANLQKSKQTGDYFTDAITEDVMADVCQKITGLTDYSFDFVDNDYEDEFLPKGYNKGRMAILKYQDSVSYISFSEKEIGGRNSSVQSVPTAFNLFYMNPYENKRLFYYFLSAVGAGTEYQMLMYRLMKTIGFCFLNDTLALGQPITAFSSVEDIMHARKANSSRNQSNNSTYITKSNARQYDIYGKTYGANKYETSMICYAIATLAQPRQRITLYEMLEGDLKELPASSLEVLKKMPNVTVVPTDMQLEKRVFAQNNSLRSPRYIYNLLSHLGRKHCALCNCEIPELIQGAHIWPVSEIKKAPLLSDEDRIKHATAAENGLWLCENHHKMFDEDLITINPDGSITYKDELEEQHIIFIDTVTTVKMLPPEILTEQFLEYLALRNS